MEIPSNSEFTEVDVIRQDEDWARKDEAKSKVEECIVNSLTYKWTELVPEYRW